MAAYNLSQLRILWEIASDGLKYQNIVGSSSPIPGDFSILNIKSDIVEQVYRTANVNDCWFQIDCGSYDEYLSGLLPTKSVVFDTVAILNHNLSAGAKIRLYGYGSAIASAPTRTNLKASGTLIFTLTPQVDVNENNLIWVAPTQITQAYRHYLIEIEDPSNQDGYIQIGRFLGGEATIFTTDENFTADFEYQEVSYKDEVKINGFTSVSNARSLKKRMTVEFRNINAAPGVADGINYRNFKRYARYCRDTLKALVIPDSRIPYMFSLYAKMSEMPREKFNFLDMDLLYVNMSIEWDEAK